MFAKTIIVKFFLKKKLSCVLPKIYLQEKYPVGYPVSGLNRISGIRLLNLPDIRPAGYPAKTVSDASLLTKITVYA
jgi:hypothetical protein